MFSVVCLFVSILADGGSASPGPSRLTEADRMLAAKEKEVKQSLSLCAGLYVRACVCVRVCVCTFVHFCVCVCPYSCVLTLSCFFSKLLQWLLNLVV